jgi:hypothetical protein
MNMYNEEAHEDVDSIVKVIYKTGDFNCFGRVVAVINEPTFIIETEAGSTFPWRQDLCRGALSCDEVDYWKERALRAEKGLQD